MPRLVVAVVQTYYVRTGAGEHDVHFLEEIDGIIRWNNLHRDLQTVSIPLSPVDCTVRPVKSRCTEDIG